MEKQERIREEKLNVESDREIELKAIEGKLKLMGCRVKEIPSDGNCMYHAIAHQLERHALQDRIKLTDVPPSLALRQLVANYIRQHPSDFEAFITMEESVSVEAYCDTIEHSQEWGGQIELSAMVQALQVRIEIISADTTLQMGQEYSDDPTLQIT